MVDRANIDHAESRNAMKTLRRFFVVALLLSVSASAHAATWYMATTGTDTGGTTCQTITTPCLTLSFTAPLLSAGDTLLFRAGTYSNSTIDTSTQVLANGTMGSPITVSAYPGGLAASTTPGVRSGAESVIMHAPTAVNLLNFVLHTSNGNPGPSWWTFEDITFDESTQTADPPDGPVYLSGGSSNNTFLHMEVKNSRIDCFTTSPNNGEAANNQFLYNSIHDCGTDSTINIGYAIYLNTSGNLVKGNDMYNNNGFGLQINNTPGDDSSNNTVSFNRIHNNVVHGSGGVGGTQGGGLNFGCSETPHCDSILVFNNLIYHNGIDTNGDTPLAGSSSVGILVFNNVTNAGVYNNTVYANQGGAGSNGDGIDAQFYNETTPPTIRNNIVYLNTGNAITDFGGSNTNKVAVIDHSVTTNPSFANVSLNDYHLTSASTIAIAHGQAVAAVTTDFDGIARPNPPAIGAYEFITTGGVTLDSVELSDCSSASVVGTTGITCTDITVGANSNRALVCHVALSLQTASSQVITWDFGGTAQTMTTIVAANSGGATGRAALWQLIAPTTGNKTLKFTWVGTSDVSVFCDSWYNVSQVGGTTSFPHSTSATGTGTTPSVTITSAANNATMDTSANPSPFLGTYTSPSQTQDYVAGGLTALDSAGSRATGASTVTHTWAIANSEQWVSVGTDIQMAGASTGLPEGLMLLGMR